jgi:hypothetical protein
VNADASGFLVGVNVDVIAQAATKMDHEVEIVLLASIGSYVSDGDPVAEIRTDVANDISALEQVVRTALTFGDERDLGTDPAFGLKQLVTIGWTSVSTAKSNPQPGLLVCWSLRKIMTRWFGQHRRDVGFDGSSDDLAAPIVYRDNVYEELMDAFESLAVVASESMQHQTLAEVLRSLGASLPDMPPSLQDRAEDLVLRSLSALGEHVLTRDLDDALYSIAEALDKAGHTKCGEAVRRARLQLARSIGLLNSRSTRAAHQRGDS